MVDFFDKLYLSIIDRNRLLKSIKFYSILRFIIRVSANVLIPYYFLVTRKNEKYSLDKTSYKNNQMIVSLTSFPSRIAKVWLVIETILRQTKKPDKIILWLSKDQFKSIDILPRHLLEQRLRGLEIRLVEGDIRSHKKYYYTLSEYPNDYLITIDDDILYRSKMLEDMFDYLNRYPSCVISQYSSEMQWLNGKLISHKLWQSIKNEIVSNSTVFFGSGGGTIFPPSIFDDDVLNIYLFMKLTPNADDVWLNAMCKLKKTNVCVMSTKTAYLPIIFRNKVTLESINNGLNQNDEQINSVREYYLNKRGIDPFSL